MSTQRGDFIKRLLLDKGEVQLPGEARLPGFAARPKAVSEGADDPSLHRERSRTPPPEPRAVVVMTPKPKQKLAPKAMPRLASKVAKIMPKNMPRPAAEPEAEPEEESCCPEGCAIADRMDVTDEATQSAHKSYRRQDEQDCVRSEYAFEEQPEHWRPSFRAGISYCPEPCGIMGRRGLRAMEVLARHVCRLGPAGGHLEKLIRDTVRRRLACASAVPTEARLPVRLALAWPDPSEGPQPPRSPPPAHLLPGWQPPPAEELTHWGFLTDPLGQEAYMKRIRCFREVFSSHGRGDTRAADQAVRKLFESTLLDGPLPQPRCSLSESTTTPDHGNLFRIQIVELRFAHNDQSELFGIQTEGEVRSVLHTAVELWAGVIDPDDLPHLRVCIHKGFWFCRTGNRRVAALRLANRMAPERISHVTVEVVRRDSIFLYGAPGRPPKLTTHRNGETCMGQWLVIKETGECVGREAERPEYGWDLLSLLVSPLRDVPELGG